MLTKKLSGSTKGVKQVKLYFTHIFMFYLSAKKTLMH